MLKKIIVIVIMMLFVSPCFAQSEQELVNSYNKITNEINGLKENIGKLQVEQIEIIGVLKYLKEVNDEKNSAVHNIEPQE